MTVVVLLIAAAIAGLWLYRKFVSPSGVAESRIDQLTASGDRTGATKGITAEHIRRAGLGDYTIHAYPGTGRVAMRVDAIIRARSSVGLRNPSMVDARKTLDVDSFWLTNGTTGDWIGSGAFLGAYAGVYDGHAISNAITAARDVAGARLASGTITAIAPPKRMTPAEEAAWKAKAFAPTDKAASRAASRARNAARGAAGAQAQAALDILWAAQDAAEGTRPL